ncbi:DUF5668 domain-containing protein [Wukongibacter baidiensis]|uniref:LiaF transmembrane domain-containing protein n=1 Tax=Wukongibacter baidiensis TaxID=1723361 RepID=UPI003D7F9114
MKTTNTLIGVIIIIIGVLFLLVNFNIVNLNFYYIWPLFIIIPGLCLEISYFTTKKNSGVLVPAGILIVIGLLFYTNILLGWHLMESLWPVFPLSVSFGLFQLYLFGTKDRGVLVSSLIIGGFSLVSLSFTLFAMDFDLLFPITLILIGFIVIFRK